KESVAIIKTNLQRLCKLNFYKHNFKIIFTFIYILYTIYWYLYSLYKIKMSIK
ncbi:hypothetical protein C0J52_12390, partial [Blattella germanica]